MTYRARAERVELDCDVDLIQDQINIPCEALNLSATGIAIASPARLRKGDSVWVGFEPDDSQGRLVLNGIVVRGAKRRYDLVWGIQFRGLDQPLLECLQHRIAQEQSVFRRPPPGIANQEQ